MSVLKKHYKRKRYIEEDEDFSRSWLRSAGKKDTEPTAGMESYSFGYRVVARLTYNIINRVIVSDNLLDPCYSIVLCLN